MKGSLHTNTLLHAVLAHDSGLRQTDWISHVFVFDVPAYPKPLLLSDAVVAIAPTLEQKAVICRNAITVAHALGIALPKVAILSAVEEVDPAIPSTIDAAALCKMADRGQITGALLDGPLAFDNAIDVEAARIKGIRSEVAGRAQILVVPDLEAGNMLAKNLAYFAKADGAGIVLGDRVPVVLTSRADTPRARMASCAVAALHADARRQSAPTVAA
jgi:phosphate acetyltransferase